MKKILSILLVTLLAPMLAFAQSAAGRLPKTVVADVLAQMPAKNVAIYDAMMNDLVKSGVNAIEILTDGMKPTGDNTAVSYAIGGLTYYVMGEGKGDARQMVQKVYIKALEKATDRDLKAFYIRQIQILGDDETLETLKKYATTKELSEEAVAAICEINSNGATKVLESIITAIPDKSVAAFAAGNKALGSQEDLILGWLGSSDVKLQKASLYALARLGGEKSVAALRKAAEAVDYTFEPTGATESYIYILKRFPNAKEIAKLLKSKDANIRTAAIGLATSSQGKAALPTVLKAMSDTDRPYRNAALVAAAPYADAEFYKALTTIKSKDNAVTTDIITFLGAQKDASQIDYIISALANADAELAAAAATSLGQINSTKGMQALLEVLFKSTDAGKLSMVVDVMKWYPTNTNKEMIAALPNLTQSNASAVLGLLSAKRAATAFDAISALATKMPEAYQALQYVATPEKFDVVCTGLESGKNNTAYTQALQEIVKQMPKDKALAAIAKRMAGKESIYYPALSAIGTPSAFAIVKEGVAKGDKNAIAAGLNWQGKEAQSFMLEKYADTNFMPQSKISILKSYINLIRSNGYNDVQRLIHLRAALSKTKATAEQNLILAEIAKCNTLNALMLAGQYLDNEATQQTAGTAVMNIALKDKEYAFWGTPVKDVLKKFIEVRKGGDAGYEKTAVQKYLDEAPSCNGFVSVFNGKDLSGWKGLVQNPVARGKMAPEQLAQAQAKANQVMATEWKAIDGEMQFTGKGENICTEKPYGDFEMYVDWRIGKHGDSGIYLRGSPQVQIWDTTLTRVGAEVGSGGLYNNQKNPSKPLVLADNAIGEWNTFYIKMVGERVTVILNGIKVVDNVILENYWDRKQPIFPVEQIELQAHGDAIAFRDIYIKELPRVEPFTLSEQEKKEGYKVLFDGISMHEWIGNTKDYVAENGTITLYPGNGGGGNLYTKDEYKDFVFRFEFMLTEAANNGLGIRTPLTGDAAYTGMCELQILDNESPVYKDLEVYQYHGSAYGIIPSKRGHLKPIGEWNYQEVEVKGSTIKVTLNGTVIMEGDLAEASKNGTIDKKEHPGLKNITGRIAFLGHGSLVKFKNIRIKELK